MTTTTTTTTTIKAARARARQAVRWHKRATRKLRAAAVYTNGAARASLHAAANEHTQTARAIRLRIKNYERMLRRSLVIDELRQIHADTLLACTDSWRAANDTKWQAAIAACIITLPAQQWRAAVRACRALFDNTELKTQSSKQASC